MAGGGPTDRRGSGWKQQCLSALPRVTLAKLSPTQITPPPPPPLLPALTSWGFPLTFDFLSKGFFPSALDGRWVGGFLLITLFFVAAHGRPQNQELCLYFCTFPPHLLTTLLLMRLVAGKGYKNNHCAGKIIIIRRLKSALLRRALRACDNANKSVRTRHNGKRSRTRKRLSGTEEQPGTACCSVF